MTVLTLDLLWINRLDTGEAISAISAPSPRSQDHSRQVAVREYANGRLRSFATPGRRARLVWQLVNIDQATKDRVVDWQAIAVQVRDYRGQKFFGIVDSVAVDEFQDAARYNATFTLQTITVVEGV